MPSKRDIFDSLWLNRTECDAAYNTIVAKVLECVTASNGAVSSDQTPIVRMSNDTGGTSVVNSSDHARLVAALLGNDDCLRAAALGLINSIRVGDINSSVFQMKDTKGRTVLHRAVLQKNLEGVKAILRHQAPLDTVDNEGDTLLHAALNTEDKVVPRNFESTMGCSLLSFYKLIFEVMYNRIPHGADFLTIRQPGAPRPLPTEGPKDPKAPKAAKDVFKTNCPPFRLLPRLLAYHERRRSSFVHLASPTKAQLSTEEQQHKRHLVMLMNNSTETSLGCAIKTGNVDVVKFVLSNGCDPNAPNDWLQPLADAAQEDPTSQMLEIFELLLQNGADPNAYSIGTFDGTNRKMTNFFILCDVYPDPKRFKMMLSDPRTDITLVNTVTGDSPMHLIIKSQNAEKRLHTMMRQYCCQLMLEMALEEVEKEVAGGPKNKKDDDDDDNVSSEAAEDAQMAAISERFVSYLPTFADGFERFQNEHVHQRAYKLRKAAAFTHMINQSNRMGKTPFSMAVDKVDIPLVRALSNCFTPKYDGKYSNDYPHIFLTVCRPGTGTEMLEMFLEKGNIDPNIVDPCNGDSLLQSAVRFGGWDAVEYLARDPRVNINGCNTISGDTTLQMAFATAFKTSDYRIINALVDHGVDVDMRGENGLAPLHMVAFLPRIHGPGCGVEALLKKFILKGANVNFVDNNGMTPLMVMTSSDMTHVGPPESDAMQKEIIVLSKILIQAGADLGKTNAEGKTALDLARRSGSRLVVDFLLAEGSK